MGARACAAWARAKGTSVARGAPRESEGPGGVGRAAHPWLDGRQKWVEEELVPLVGPLAHKALGHDDQHSPGLRGPAGECEGGGGARRRWEVGIKGARGPEPNQPGPLGEERGLIQPPPTDATPARDEGGAWPEAMSVWMSAMVCTVFPSPVPSARMPPRHPGRCVPW